MKIAITYSSAELGIEAPAVSVEAAAVPGLPQTQIVGLPETAVRESKDRVKAAIQASGFEYPSQRITVNLAPADLPKSSGRYDLAIAIAILVASKQIEPNELERYEFLGELSLTGKLRGVRGVLPAISRSQSNNRHIVVPADNENEACLNNHDTVLIAQSLLCVVNHLCGTRLLSEPKGSESEALHQLPSLSEVRGQAVAKRALSVAAAGGHNMLMVGPPGTGKTMLASRLPALIPPMSTTEAMTVASIVSVSKQPFHHQRFRLRPFRAPHHTATSVAIAGGGNPPRPGEISLAHLGVLFLDEFPEFARHVLEVLREPLESGEVWISRAGHQVRYPAKFQLIAAMNPCPCGYLTDPRRECECTADQIWRYRSRISGPLLDRIDIHIEVPPLAPGEVARAEPEVAEQETESFESLVLGAREKMLRRQEGINADLTNQQVREHCRISKPDASFLDLCSEKLGLSTRAYFKILKVARTIADMSDSADVCRQHLTEAVSYRKMDRSR